MPISRKVESEDQQKLQQLKFLMLQTGGQQTNVQKILTANFLQYDNAIVVNNPLS